MAEDPISPRVPPFSEPAEATLLSCFMRDNSHLKREAPTLQVQDFYKEQHRLIYLAKLSLQQQGTAVDSTTLMLELRREGALERAGGYGHLMTIEATAPAVSNAGHYAKAVSDLGRLRRILHTAEDISSAAYGEPGDIAHFASQAMERLAAVATVPARDVDTGAASLASHLPRVIDRLQHGVPRTSTGWPLLDRVLSDEPARDQYDANAPRGFVVPSLNILGAPPKVGKSTWAQIVAERHACSGGVSYYVDFENGNDRFLRRLLYRRAQVSSYALRCAQLSGTQSAAWKAALDDVEHGDLGRRLFLEPNRSISQAGLLENVRAYRKLAGAAPLLVVIDSLHKLPMEMQNRRDGIDGWLRCLEAARDMGVVVLVISELRRGREGDHDTSATGFKESGGIEYSGDLVFTMEPVAPAGAETPAERPTAAPYWLGTPSTLRIVYNRDGDTGPVARYFAEFPYYGMGEEGLTAPVTTGVAAPPHGGNGQHATSGRVLPAHL